MSHWSALNDLTMLCWTAREATKVSRSKQLDADFCCGNTGRIISFLFLAIYRRTNVAGAVMSVSCFALYFAYGGHLERRHNILTTGTAAQYNTDSIVGCDIRAAS